jgi:hypothetical protein
LQCFGMLVQGMMHMKLFRLLHGWTSRHVCVSKSKFKPAVSSVYAHWQLTVLGVSRARIQTLDLSVA